MNTVMVSKSPVAPMAPECMVPVDTECAAPARRSRRGVRAMRGMTLIELMIVVVIIGILAAVAYPSYQNQVQQTRRSDGKATLLDTAQQLERCFTRYNSYTHDQCDIEDDITGAGVPSPEEWYLITDTVMTASTFTLVATPQGAQTSDTRCGNLTLTQSGDRTASGSVPDTCW